MALPIGEASVGSSSITALIQRPLSRRRPLGSLSLECDRLSPSYFSGGLRDLQGPPGKMPLVLHGWASGRPTSVWLSGRDVGPARPPSVALT
jgi:hypothetical protein